jgi:hypothetical protein
VTVLHAFWPSPYQSQLVHTGRCRWEAGRRPFLRSVAQSFTRRAARLMTRLLVGLLAFSQSGPLAWADMPTPVCKLLAQNLVPFAFSERNIAPELNSIDRRNADYLFSRLRDLVARPPARMYLYKSDSSFLYLANTSLFFPNEDCPTGCTAYAVRADHAGPMYRFFYFVSHVVVQPNPVVALIFLDADTRHLMMIRKTRVRVGSYTSEIRTVEPDGRELHEFSGGYRACLLNGEFNFSGSNNSNK